MLRVPRRSRGIASSTQMLLEVRPVPVGGTAEAVEIEFEGWGTSRLTRYPPSLLRLVVAGPERPLPYQFLLSIFAEPARSR